MKDHKFIDVPMKRPWMKRWFIRAAKSSLVFGAIGFAASAWDDFTTYQKALAASAKSEIGYRCAAVLSDDTLSRGINTFGTIDIKDLGCTSDSFIVSMAEVRDVRAGKMDFSPYAKPFYWEKSISVTVGSMILSMFLMTYAILAVAILRWVWN